MSYGHRQFLRYFGRERPLTQKELDALSWRDYNELVIGVLREPEKIARAICRKYLAHLVGLYEEDAIEGTFGAPACEMDCDKCPKGQSGIVIIGG